VLARTDAEAADLVTSDVDERDRPFLTGERTAEGFYRTKKGFDQALARGLAYAEYADMVWCETGTPDLDFARRFAEGIRKKHPGKMLAYNCSPSFNWKRNLDDATIARFQRELGAMGYKFQFITLAGFHSLNYSMFELAHGYARNDMSAFVELQQKEFAAAEKGFTAVKHQREVGTSYFDAVTQVVSGGRRRRRRCTARPRTSSSSTRRRRRSSRPGLSERARQGPAAARRARVARRRDRAGDPRGFDRHYRLLPARGSARQDAVRAGRLGGAARARARAHRDVRRARRGGVDSVLARFPEAETDESLGPRSSSPTSPCCTSTGSPSWPKHSSTRSPARSCTGATTATSSSSGGPRSRPSTWRATSLRIAATTRARAPAACARRSAGSCMISGWPTRSRTCAATCATWCTR
jgi:hypothetical protein